jgi:hypothetical protein
VDWGFGVSQPYIFTVTQVDSIITADGKTRKTLTLSASDGKFNEWIEGIGDADWIFLYPNYVQSVSGGFYFECFTSLGLLIYPSGPAPGSCITPTRTRYREVVEIAIFPNPLEDKFFVSSNIDIIGFEILDVSGKAIHKEDHLNTQQIEFSDAKKLGKGLFFIRLVTSDQQIFIRRMLKI